MSLPLSLFLSPKRARDALNVTPGQHPSTSYMFQLYLIGKPGQLGGARPHVYPASYLRALRRGVAGAITDAAVEAFNLSTEGRAAIALAKADFDREFSATVKRCPGEGCILLSNVATLLGVTAPTVQKWVKDGLIEVFEVEGAQVVDAEKLRGKLKWSH